MIAQRPRFLHLSVAAILMVASIVGSATFASAFADGVVLSDENDDSAHRLHRTNRRALLKRSKFALTEESSSRRANEENNKDDIDGGSGGGGGGGTRGGYFDANKYAADDALARMYGNVNKNAPKFTITNPTQDKEKVERAAKMQAEEVAKGDKTAIEFKNMENEIEGEAKEAVAKATDGDLELLGTTLRSSEIEVTAEEKQRWSFMDSSQLRAELMTMTKERNRLAAALGKLATNCSQEMKMLFYKVENLEDTRKFYENENEQLTGKHEKCKNDHDLLKEHAAKKVVKHMDHLGVDTTFVKPHRMDVKELLEAAELADKHHEDELFKRRMELEEREGKQHSLEDLARSGKKHDKEYKKRMKQKVEGYRFKTIHREEEED